MYDFKIEAGDTATLYRDLASALEGLVSGEPDPVANMANAAALIWESLPDLNWAGFYRNVGGELVLGPFQGRPACIRIPFGQGVCGAAAATQQVQRIDDVHAFHGHIPCDAASNSELVVPIVRDGALLAVLDLDSPKTARFTAEDEAGCVKLAEILRPSALTQLLEPLVAKAPRDQHHRARQAARVIAAEVGHQRARVAARRRAQHQCRDLFTLADIFAHGLHRLALLDDDLGFDPALVENLADRGADHPLDAQPLLLLDRVLNPAELDEVLRFDDPQHLDAAVGLGRAPGGEAQRDRGLGAVVDHHQIGAFRFVGPHVPTGCVKPRLCASARLGFRRRLDRNRRIRFEPAQALPS